MAKDTTKSYNKSAILNSDIYKKSVNNLRVHIVRMKFEKL